MTNTKECFVVRSPRRKQIGGIWMIAIAVGSWAMWSNKVDSPEPDLLFGLGCVSFLLGIYRCLSFSTSIFKRDVQEVECHSYHFGIFKKVKSSSFDKVDILRRDALLPYCQLYAYNSKEKLRETLSAEEMKAYDNEHTPLPGLVILDQANKKECEKAIENIWRFYGLWQEPVVEEVPAPVEDDDFDDDDYEDED